MGKHKRKRRDDDSAIDSIYRQMKKLKKSIRKRTHNDQDHNQDTNEELPAFNDVLDTLNEPVLDQTETTEIPKDQPIDLVQSEVEPDQVPELLNDILGLDPTQNTKYGTSIYSDIASRWEHITKEGLQKDQRLELLKMVTIPENCKFLEAPGLNPEIKAAISEPVYKRDKVLISQQNLLGQATACIGVALSAMLKDKNRDIEITKTIGNAGRLLCELFHTKSNSRRSLIQFALNKETKDIVTQTKIETHLFGDNLGDALKAGKAINKTGSEIRYSRPAEKPKQKQTLNYRGPPRRRQQVPPAPSAGRTTHNKQASKRPPQRPVQKAQPYKHRK